jgi:general secretion pathway protein C
MIIANMQTNAWKPWMPRIAAFSVGLLLAASTVFWVLRWPVRDAAKPLPLVAASDEAPVASAADISRLLGAASSPSETAGAADASSRFQLTGIVALGSGRGAALVSIDGKPARPYRIGSQLEEGLVLQSVQQRSVALGADAKGPARMTLELPRRQP